MMQYFKVSYYLREFYSFKKPTPLNLMKQAGEKNLMQPFFSHGISNSCGELIGFLEGIRYECFKPNA